MHWEQNDCLLESLISCILISTRRIKILFWLTSNLTPEFSDQWNKSNLYLNINLLEWLYLVFKCDEGKSTLKEIWEGDWDRVFELDFGVFIWPD